MRLKEALNMATMPIAVENHEVPVQAPSAPTLDEYGRDASERTVELHPKDAEAIDAEVADGRWQTYDDALRFILQRGFAEIKRTRDAARKLATVKLLASKTRGYQEMFAQHPELIANGEFVTKMMQELGKLSK